MNPDKSIQKDNSDWNSLRHQRNRHYGFTRTDEWYQGKPFFWTAEGQDVPIMGHMRGGHAFLICGGPSFNDLNKRPLRLCYTMCMNNSVKACMPTFRPDAWISVDCPHSFLHTIWADPKIMKFAPHAHTQKPIWNNDEKRKFELLPRQCPNMFYYHRNECWEPSRWLFEDSINWGNHNKIKDNAGVVGKRSVMIAALKILFLLGFRQVYLVGADFSMKSGKTEYSFEQSRSKSSAKGNSASYETLDRRFTEARPFMEEAGYFVYNCNPKSNLKAFDHMPYAQALDRALWFTSDRKSYQAGKMEDTANLYNTKWLVCPRCKQDNRCVSDSLKKGVKCIKCDFVFNKGSEKKHKPEGA